MPVKAGVSKDINSEHWFTDKADQLNRFRVKRY